MQKKTTMTLPRREHRFVTLLCERIVSGGQPIRVPVIPDSGARINDCFLNVKKRIERHGGDIQHGWCIWELPGLFIEGEFHAVWVSPSKDLIDVSPKKDKETEILFLPDPLAVFDEASFNRRDNIRMAIFDHPAVHDYIRVSEEYINYLQSTTCASNPRISVVKEHETERLLHTKASLQAKLQTLVPSPYDVCPCQSGTKFKWCCGSRT